MYACISGPNKIYEVQEMESTELVVNNQTGGIQIPMKDMVELNKHDASVGLQEEDIKVIPDEKIEKSLPSLTNEEYEQLKESIQKDGCRDALIARKEDNTLIDGYHRYRICQKLGINFEITYMSFPTKQDAVIWRITNQLARRNMTGLQKDYQIGKFYNEMKQGRGGD